MTDDRVLCMRRSRGLLLETEGMCGVDKTNLLGDLSSLGASLDRGLASGGLLHCAKRKYQPCLLLMNTGAPSAQASRGRPSSKAGRWCVQVLQPFDCVCDGYMSMQRRWISCNSWSDLYVVEGWVRKTEEACEDFQTLCGLRDPDSGRIVFDI